MADPGWDITRADWGSVFGVPAATLIGPLPEVYVHHFAGDITLPATGSYAAALMRSAERNHVIAQGWRGIGYTCTVDDDGLIYEGRGWLVPGAHTEGYNSKGHGICWIGNSELRPPSRLALQGIARAIRNGQRAGAVIATPALTIVDHRARVPGTACCGAQLRAQLDVIRSYVAAGPPIDVPAYPTTEEEPPVIHAMQLPRTDTPGDATVFVRNEATGEVVPMEAIGGLKVYNELVARGLARPFVPDARLSWEANLALAILDHANVNDGVPDVPRPGRTALAS